MLIMLDKVCLPNDINVNVLRMGSKYAQIQRASLTFSPAAPIDPVTPGKPYRKKYMVSIILLYTKVNPISHYS